MKTLIEYLTASLAGGSLGAMIMTLSLSCSTTPKETHQEQLQRIYAEAWNDGFIEGYRTENQQ